MESYWETFGKHDGHISFERFQKPTKAKAADDEGVFLVELFHVVRCDNVAGFVLGGTPQLHFFV